MSITTTQFLNIADNIAKTLVDVETDFISDPANNAPTVATITNGQSAVSSSLQARFAALSAGDQLGKAGQSLAKTVAGVVGYLTVPNATLYSLYAPFLLGLDQDLGDMAEFINANSLQVHPEFAACFNYIGSNAQRLFGANYTPTPILPAFIFPSAASQTLASIAETGATTGTFSAGTALDLTKYAPQQLYLKNTAGSSTTGTATSFTVTYTNAAGNAAASATQALSGALAAGATLAIAGAVGSAVSAITITSGANTDAIAVVVVPLRTVAY